MQAKVKKPAALVMDVLTSGTNSALEAGQRSRVVFLNSVTLAGGIMIALFAALNFSVGNLPLAIACASVSAIVFANFAFIRATRRFLAGGAVDCIIIFLFYLLLAYSGGEAGSGVLWSMTYPLIALFLLGPVWGSAVALSYGGAVAAVIFHPLLNKSGFPPLYSARVVGTYFFIWVFALIYETVRRATQARLLEAKKQTDDILAGVYDGIFLMDRNFRLGAVHSKRLEELVESTDPAGKPLLDLLAPALAKKDFDAASDYLDLFFAGTVNEALLAEINPLSEIGLNFPRPDGSSVFRRLRFQFIRIASAASPFPLMGVASDFTDEYALKRKLEAEEKEHKRSMESLFQIIHVDPAMMREFISDTEAELETVSDLMRSEESSGAEVLETLFQSAHAIKGNAALLGLQEFASKVHDYEDSVKAKIDGGHQWRDLLELTLALADIKKELDSLKFLIQKILRFQSETKTAGLRDGSLLTWSIEKIVKRESARCGIPASVRFEGFNRDSVPDEYRKLAKDVIIQLIRNSFAHGFEDKRTRAERRKDEAGLITLSVAWDEANVTLRYSDDGRGLDPELIRRKALSLPEFSVKAKTMSAGELGKLIFHPGFSTAESAGLGAGRGIGMSLVKRRIGEAGGKLAVRSALGRYLEFVVSLPIPRSAEAVS